MQLGNIQWRTSCVLGFVLGACDERKKKGSTSRDFTVANAGLLGFLSSWPVLWAGQASACEDRSSSSESGRGKMGFSLTEIEVEEVSVCVCAHQSPDVSLWVWEVWWRSAGPCYPSDLIHRLLPYSLYSSLLAKHSSITPSYLLVPLSGILAQTATSPSPRWVSMLRPPYQRGLF